MQVELRGGSERHPDTLQIHTGINYIRSKGKPLYNFAPSSVALNMDDQGSSICPITSSPAGSAGAISPACCQPIMLKYISPDPLQQSGGLWRVSEGGRLPETGGFAIFGLDADPEV